MNNNNPFYISDEYYFFVYETEQMLRENRTHQRVAETTLETIEELAVWRGGINMTKVSYCLPGEPIFLIKKSERLTTQGDECWNVIVGEKIGWIAIRPFIKLKSLVAK